MTFVIDENLPRSLAPALQGAGYNAKDVRDHGLRGKPDAEVFAFAQAQTAVLITADLGFGNVGQFPLDSHHGIILVRLPEELPAATRVAEILSAIENLQARSLTRTLVIISPGKIRVRSHQA